MQHEPTSSGEAVEVGPDSIRSHWVSIGGARVHALVHPGPHPEARPVVVVHGHSLNSAYLRPALRRLARTYAVYAPDLAGYGLSDALRPAPDIAGHADLVARWARRLRLQDAVFVGNSMGCQVVTSLATRYGFARAVVLAGPPLDPSRRSSPEAVARFFVNMVREHGNMRLLNFQGIVRADKRTLLANLRHTVHYRTEADLPRVRVPALVLRGHRDPIVGGEWARHVAELLPAAEFVEVEGGTHLLPHHTAAEFARLVSGFDARV